jgi:hypothetical protein
MPAFDPALVAFFDRVLDLIGEHASYGPAVSRAAADGRPLALNYHTHGPEHGYCASVCALDGPTLDLGGLMRLGGELAELAHIRGVGKSEGECGMRMAVFASLLRARYRLTRDPEIYLGGQPWHPGREGTTA